MMTKEKARRIIRDIEYFSNALNYANGADVEVRNIKVQKDIVAADVIFHFWADGKHERYDGCKYSVGKLKEFSKKWMLEEE